jgi:hypothetical protein
VLWVCLGLAIVIPMVHHLCVTRGRPWRFRPIGDLWWSQGYGRGFPYDTRAKDKYLENLATGSEAERASAALHLADPNHLGFAPQVEPVLKALSCDPSPRVRRAAAAGLYWQATSERVSADTQLHVVTSLAQAMVRDEDEGTRYTVGCGLVAVVDRLSRRQDGAVHAEASTVVARYARKGLQDRSPRVVSQCRELLTYALQPSEDQ